MLRHYVARALAIRLREGISKQDFLLPTENQSHFRFLSGFFFVLNPDLCYLEGVEGPSSAPTPNTYVFACREIEVNRALKEISYGIR